MDYKLQDILDLEKFQALQNRLNEIYSFPSAIIDNQGNILTAVAWQEICTQFHRKNPQCLEHCLKSDRYILEHIEEADPAVTYRCPHGLVDNAAPIIIEGVHYANFFTGQFFLEKPDLNFFRKQAGKYGFDEAAYLEAVKKVPIWSQEQLNNYLYFIKGLIAIITESGLKNLKEIQYRKNLENSERRSESIIQAAMDGFWLTDERGILRDVNESYCRMSGYSSQELVGMHVQDFEVMDTPEDISNRIQTMIKKGADRFISEHRRKNGSVFPVEVSIKYLPGSLGNFMVFIQDITERKKAEDMLRESRNRLELAATSAQLGIWDWDIKNNTMIWDAQMYRLYGLEQNNPVSGIDLWRNGVHPDDLPMAWKATQTAMKGEEKFDTEFRVRHPDGQIRFLKADGTVLFDDKGNPVRMLGINRDITRQKQAEQSLKEAKLFLDNMSDIAYITDTEGNLIWVNAMAEKIIGLSSEQILGRSFLPLFIESDRDSLIDVYKRTLTGESLENTLTFMSGITCHFTSIPKYSSQGEIVGTFGVARDITEKLNAENKLRISENRLKRAQQAAKIGNWEYDIQTGKIWGSEEAFRIYGIERTTDFLPLDQVERCIPEARRVNQALVDLITINKPYDIEFEIEPQNRSGSTIIHSIAELFYNHEGKPLKVIGVIQDVTESKNREQEEIKLKEQLLQTQKLDSIGQLAGGIAHDFNNQLTGILGYAELLASSIQDEQLRGYAENICHAVENGSTLTRQLLSFARKGQYAMEYFNLYDICEEVIGILERTIDRQIQIRQEKKAPHATIKGDPHQIQNALLNIALNARDAIKGKGTILFETTLLEISESPANSVSNLDPGTYVCLNIKDDGCGMEESVRE